MQQQLFETVEQTKKQGLVISGAGKKSLTKNQEAFNRLTQKIERLHKDIEKKELQFDMALKIYGNEFQAIEIRLTGQRRQMVVLLWGVYKSKKLSQTHTRYLRVILKNQLRELFADMRDEPDKALKVMFAELEGQSYERLLLKEKEMMKTEIQEMFEEMEVEMDLGDVDLDDEKAMAEKIAEVQQKLMEKQEKEQQRFQQRRQQKKKTAKQVENERMRASVDEMKQKNISTIYKQLAKLFHPDLELQEERRAEKEVLMKELTAAYEAKNLHTLLTLELKWIHKENDHLESLSEEKLAIYLQILREQARDLEQEINRMFQQPRYQVLVQEFGPSVQRVPVEIVKQNLRRLQNVDVSLKRDLEDYQSPNSLRYIKEMINEWKTMQRQGNKMEAEFMRRMFS
ncbi:MAG: J domain-containing protein [Ferruginibacter sp.]